jgi:hypothetical protein
MPPARDERHDDSPNTSLPMRRIILFAAVLFAALFTAAPAGADANPDLLIGFGEQRPSVFGNPHWQRLDLPDTRLLVGWDALRYRWQRREIDHWMKAAQAAGARPLVAFSRSRAPWRTRKLPSAAEYRRWFLKFRHRYPWVRNYLAWNEANHCSQPTCHKPEAAARYFDVMKSACDSCKIVAADVLDSDDMVGWLRRFRAAARHRPTIWGLHNYLDANRFRTTGTELMLSTVRGEIWFTETGGLVKRKNTSPHKFPDSPSHAAKATRWVLNRLVTLSPRITRVYLYHFQNQGPDAFWDSGVLDPRGRPRPAYEVLKKYVVRVQRLRDAARPGQ